MTQTRTETDSLGPIQVPADCYWGAQTQRSLDNFPIGIEKMPAELIHALMIQKKAAALVNKALGLLPVSVADAIVAAADDVLSGSLTGQFPLAVWQTGSGTQTNMNANEVLANRANERLGHPRGVKTPVHPNDHCNMGQSSNDTFPTVMHIAAAKAITGHLLPALRDLQNSLEEKAQAEAARKAAERARQREAEEVQRDRALVLRYPNQTAHDRARANALEQVDLVIGGLSEREKSLALRVQDLDQQLAAFSAQPNSAPSLLRRQRLDAEAELAQQRRLLQQQRAERDRINTKFNEELARLTKLWLSDGR